MIQSIQVEVKVNHHIHQDQIHRGLQLVDTIITISVKIVIMAAAVVAVVEINIIEKIIEIISIQISVENPIISHQNQ